MSAIGVLAPAAEVALAPAAETILQEEVLGVFRQRIEGILELVQCMPQKDKYLAVEIWNELSERLQDLLAENPVRSDSEEGEDVIVKPPKESSREVNPAQVIADDEETESEDETTEREGRDAIGGDDLRPAGASSDRLSEVTAEQESAGEVEAKEAVTMTVVQDEDPAKLSSEPGEGAADSNVENAQDDPPAVEVTKIVSADETESKGESQRTQQSEQGEPELTAQAILTENNDGHQVLVELPSNITLDSESNIVVKDGGLEGIVLTVDTDANTAKVSKTSKEDEWLSHAEKVTVDEYPPMLDEKANKRIKKHDDGSHEVLIPAYCTIIPLYLAQSVIYM